MKNLLTPQIKAQELVLNQNFQHYVKEQSYGKLRDMISDTVRESYLEFAFSVLHQIEQDVKNNKKFDLRSIKDIRDKLNMTRLFKPL